MIQSFQENSAPYMIAEHFGVSFAYLALERYLTSQKRGVGIALTEATERRKKTILKE